MADYTRLLRVARGQEPADLVVRNGQLVNVLTGEIYPATVGICEDVIAYVTAPDNDHCASREVLGQVALLVAGLLSQSSVPEVAGEFAPYVAAANAVGVVGNPIRLVTSLPLPVVPNFRPTDLGLVDVSRQILVPAFEFSR